MSFVWLTFATISFATVQSVLVPTSKYFYNVLLLVIKPSYNIPFAHAFTGVLHTCFGVNVAIQVVKLFNTECVMDLD